MRNSKKKRLDSIYSKYQERFSDKKIVFGNGDIDSRILFIGEAPGKDEIKKKIPFVGKAGAKLTQMLEYLELDRQDIYITNAIKYGLRKTNKTTNRESNRPARRSELSENRPFLLEEIKCIDPKIVVTLGAIPFKMLIDKYDIAITKYSGKEIKLNSYMLFPLLHPAALMYNPSLIVIFNENLLDLKKIIYNK